MNMNPTMRGAEWALRLIGTMTEEDVVDMLNGKLSADFTANEILDMAVRYLGGISSGYEVRYLVNAIYGVEFTRYI